ncbi:molybdate ABC transporter substrate-binding protein [Corynebacterium pelargi]|uniref:Molybdate-binding periplasmic protein n=1 Tax=Corynebacterium pelargi TaxID=1471400 RepID=A0A410W9H2_9CORY|nr:molybdate ABC transporter substrate-binding protein [Corynebacterium pelargi]QAU52602.1 Molybdate-binding periplasmic protein precursor [Corynebacterium pelargi]GGG77600.1 molybdate-binding protein [Corynebacterium pelargi]
MRIALPLALVLLLSACAQNGQLTVFGAASTRLINESLVQQSGEDLQFHNAGSATLVQQLREGAPADVLITANEATMQQAQDAGLVTHPRAVATNSMVLIVPKGNPAGVRGIDDLDKAVVVICDVQVPCGDTTARLEKANNATITPASLEQSVSDVLGKVTSGEADAGVVYQSDAAAAGDSVEVIEIPHANEYPNRIMAAVVKDSSHRDQAQAVVDTLGSEQFRAIWQEQGFTPQ